MKSIGGMFRNPFFVFVVVISIMVCSIIFFIQSKGFAQVVKRVATKYLPKDMGITGDFSELEVKLFPPGISIKNPTVVLGEHNLAHLPAGSKMRAEQLDLNFRPIQMFSGNIRVHEVRVINGDVDLILSDSTEPVVVPVKKVKQPGVHLDVHWDELFQIHAEAVAVENTHLRIHSRDDKTRIDFVAQNLRIGQWSGAGGIGYELELALNHIQGATVQALPLPKEIDGLELQAFVNAQGVRIENLALNAKGLQVQGAGKILGNVLAPRALALEGTLKAQGEIAPILDLINVKVDKLDGHFDFNGKVRADLLRLKETLRAEGELAGQNIVFQTYHMEKVKLDGAYSTGEISLSKAEITEPERDRVGGHQAADGGKIRIGAIKIPLTGLEGKFTVPLELERAHVHWLAAIALKAVYPLDFRVTGKIDAVIDIPKEAKNFSVQADLKLEIDKFLLDNQRLGQEKPQHRIVQIPHFALNGKTHVNGKGVYLDDVHLEVGHSNLKATGKIDAKGWDINANGPVQLKELGEISQNEIRGDGTLIGRVHGPGSNVIIDFDIDLQNAYYLKMDFGSLRGRVTWDDDPSHLLLTDLHMNKNGTVYVANGMLDLGKADSLSINIGIPHGNIRELIKIFDLQTHDLWWFPHALNGEMAGNVLVSGGISMAKLDIEAHMAGNDWEFVGERFKSVKFTGGYTKGKYYLADLHAVKRTGRINGRISFDQSDKPVEKPGETPTKKDLFDWDLRTDDMNISDLDHVARLDVPIRGKLSFASAGSGPSNDLRSATMIAISDLIVRGSPLPATQINLTSEARIANLQASLLGGEGMLEARYDFNPGARSYIHADFRHLDYSPLILLLNPSLIQDPTLAGYFSGDINLNFLSGEAELASGDISIQEYFLGKNDTKFTLSKPMKVKVADGSFEFTGLGIKGNQSEALVSLKSRRAVIEGTIGGDLDASMIEFFTSTVLRSKGTFDLDFLMKGTLKSPELYGRATLDSVSLQVPAVDSPLENVTGAIQVKQNVISLQNISADLAGGRVTAEGNVDLFTTRYPSINLRGTVNGSKIRVPPFQYVKLHGNIGLHGEEIPYLIDGSVVIDSALSKEKILNRRSSTGLKAIQYTPPPNPLSKNGYPTFKLNIQASADRGILVQNDLFNAELKAKVTIVNTLETPGIVGSAELVQGKMTFKDRDFQIQSAAAEFDNPTNINPLFNMTSTTEVNGTKIQVYASGRLDKMKIDLTSSPVLPEQDILSLLTLGVTSTDTKRLSATDRAVFEQGEAASLILNSLDFNREVENKTGIQIQLDESANFQQAPSIFRPQSSAPDTAAPRIVIRRRVGNGLDLSYGSTVGVGANNEKEASAEAHVSKGFSVIGVWDNYDSGIETPNQTSYGVDFKLQTRFK